MKNINRKKISNMILRKTLPLCVMVLTFTTTVCLPYYEAEAYTISTNSDLALVSDAGIVIDFDTGQVLYEKNADKMLIPASLTKIMTTYILYEEIEAGNLTLNSLIPVSSHAATISRNSSYSQAVPLTAGSKLTVDNLIKLILVPSASASCIVVAEYISGSEAAFVKRMNETAERLNMDVKYENCHGSRYHYVTARSQALLVQDFIKRFPEVLKYTSISGINHGGRYYPNTNRFFTMSRYANVDGFKSGNFGLSGYCLASTINKDGRRLIAITLKSSSITSMYTDHTRLFNHVYSKIGSNSLIYDGIGEHPLRKDIEQFYTTGFSPYPKGSTYAADTPIWSAEFYGILDNIVEHYGLDKKPLTSPVIEANLTNETAMAIIDSIIPFKISNPMPYPDRESIAEAYRGAVDRTMSQNILPIYVEENFNPQDVFTKADTATAIVNLVDYIESELSWLKSDVSTDKRVTFETPIDITIPFEFNTYYVPYATTPAVTEYPYQSRQVQLLGIAEGGWWQISIDGVSQWFCSGDNLAYCDSNIPMYDSLESMNVVDILSPQVIAVLDRQGDYLKISTWQGDCWIKATATNATLKNSTHFNIPTDFMIYNDVSEATYGTGVNYQSQTVELLHIGENGFWYVKGNGFEGWLNAKDKFIYVSDNTSLLDTPSDDATVASVINSQVLAIEQVQGVFVQVPTWLGAKWVKM